MDKGFFKRIVANIPSEEELLALHRKEFEDNKQNKNALSYWYPKVKAYFRTPKTQVISMPWETWDALTKLGDVQDISPSIKEIGEWLSAEILEGDLDLTKDLFMKTGSFSGKFNFKNCFIPAKKFNDLGEKLANICYDCMLVDCEFIPEVVIREFIHTPENRPNIYNGMKLNTEFRVFYDFDEKKVLGTYNYWDWETMLDGIHDKDDLEIFKSVGKEIEQDFENNKSTLESMVSIFAPKVDLEGRWSMDFMLKNQTFWLIDMALASQSYFYDKVVKNEE